MTIILMLHVSLALIMSILTASTAVSAVGRYTDRFSAWLIPSFIGTVASGIALALVAPHTFGRFCVTMAVASMTVFVVRRLYIVRVQNTL